MRGLAAALLSAALAVPAAAQVNGGFETSIVGSPPAAPWVIEYATRNTGGFGTWGAALPLGAPAATVITSSTPLVACQSLRIDPYEGAQMAQLNDLIGQRHATRISQTFSPTAFDLATSGILVSQVGAMLVDPGTGHSAGEQPGFRAELFVNNVLQPGAVEFTATQAAAAGWQQVGNCGVEPVYYKRFQFCVNTAQYRSTDVFRVQLTVWDCSLGGHGGMAWVDGLRFANCTPPPSGMVGWWGDPACADRAGAPFQNGTRVGPSYANSSCSRVSTALAHRNTTYYRVANHADFNFPASQDFSIDLWVNPTIVAGRIEPLVSKMCYSTSGYGPGYFLYLDNGRPALLLADASFLTSVHMDTTVQLPINEWSHLTVTVARSGTPTVKFFLNGTQLSGVYPAPLLTSLANTEELRLGGPPCGNAFTTIHSGCTDEIEIFRRVLAPSEIGALVAASCKGKCRTCVVPTLAANVDLASSTNIFRAGLNRVQCFYDTSVFTPYALGPVLIDRLEWRLAGGVTGTPVTYPNVEIWVQNAAVDYLTPSTTFAANRSGTPTLAYSGPVTITPGAGTTPNSYGIDIPLTTPFLYDPSAGSDLLVELVLLTAPTPLVGTTLSTTSDAAQHGCNTVRSVGSTTALTGAVSAFCPVIRVGYTEIAGAARIDTFGTGCYQTFGSFYELFASNSVDLAGTTIALVPNGVGYFGTTSGSPLQMPSTSGLALGDDQVSSPIALPFTFPFPGGATSTIAVDSNGSVLLGGTGPSLLGGQASALLGSSVPRIAISMQDLLPDGATNLANVYYEATASSALITWLNVPCFGATSGTSTFQIAIDATGLVELRYQSLVNNSTSSTGIAITGFSPGGGSQDPGSIDLSVGSFSTSVDQLPLGLTASPRPILGASVTLTTTDMPPVGPLSINLIDFVSLEPGVDLAMIGAPGCTLFVSPTITNVAFGGPTTATTLALPNQTALIGVTLFSQSAAFTTANAFGFVLSNGLQLTLGSN